jgi:hypothetical protein
MIFPSDFQSYGSAGRIVAATAQKDKEGSAWKEIEEEDDNILVELE